MTWCKPPKSARALSTIRCGIAHHRACRANIAAFSLLWVNGKSGDLIDKVGLVRTVPVGAGGAGGKAGWSGRAGRSLDAGSTARAAALVPLGRMLARRAGAGGLTVALRAERAAGRVKFSLRANRNCRAVLFDLSSGGRLALLAPQPNGPPIALKAGQELALPAQGPGFSLTGPRGVNRICVLALEEPAGTGGEPLEIAQRWSGGPSAGRDAVTVQVEGDEPARVERRPAAKSGAPGRTGAAGGFVLEPSMTPSEKKGPTRGTDRTGAGEEKKWSSGQTIVEERIGAMNVKQGTRKLLSLCLLLALAWFGAAVARAQNQPAGGEVEPTKPSHGELIKIVPPMFIVDAETTKVIEAARPTRTPCWWPSCRASRPRANNS